MLYGQIETELPGFKPPIRVGVDNIILDVRTKEKAGLLHREEVENDRTKSIKSCNILKLVFKMLKAEGLFCTHKKFELQRLTMRNSTQRQEKCTEGLLSFL